MTTSVERRLRTLESSGGRECPRCGFDGVLSKVNVVVRVNEKAPGPDDCPECGRLLVVRVGWGDRATEKRLTHRYREE